MPRCAPASTYESYTTVTKCNMSTNVIDLVALKELFEKHFFIPDYQRGYRWTKQQVVDLLEDLNEFDQEPLEK